MPMGGAAGVLAVIAGTLLATGLCVMLHYEGLYRMWRYAHGHTTHTRRQPVQVLLAIFGVMALHMLQIVIFGTVWWGLLQFPGTGTVANIAHLQWHGALFLSSLSYTSLGFDALVPMGAVRILASVEALTGLVLVAWSASFAFLLMQRHWRVD